MAHFSSPLLGTCKAVSADADTAQPPIVARPAVKVYLDVKVEGQSAGRIVISLFDDVKVASQRFADLAEGKEGVGYRLSKFDGIFSVSNCMGNRATLGTLMRLEAFCHASTAGLVASTA